LIYLNNIYTVANNDEKSATAVD